MGAAALPLAMGAMGMIGGMMSKDKGGGQVGFMSSPAQEQLLGYSLPLAQKAMQFGLGNITYKDGGKPITNVAMPVSGYGSTTIDYSNPYYSTGGGWDYMGGGAGNQNAMYTLTGGARSLPTRFGQPSVSAGNIENLWPLPSYNIPSPEYMMPTAATMNAISPDVWSGIMQPYQKVEKQLMETLGAGGALGSAMGGFSGQGAAGLGKYWAEAAPGIGMQAWNMISPALQQGWGAGLQQAQNLWAEQMQQYKYPWQAAPSFISMGMPFPYVQQPSGSPMAGMGSLLSGMGSLMGGMGGAGAMGGGK